MGREGVAGGCRSPPWWVQENQVALACAAAAGLRSKQGCALATAAG